jgi:hypothetical protein
MTEKTVEYRVTITGPEKSREQLLHELSKLEGEAERSGIDVTVERVETEETGFDAEFS